MNELIMNERYREIYDAVVKFVHARRFEFSPKPYRFEDLHFKSFTSAQGTYVTATATADDCYLFSLGKRLLYTIEPGKEQLPAATLSHGLHLGVMMITVPMAEFEAWYQAVMVAE